MQYGAVENGQHFHMFLSDQDNRLTFETECDMIKNTLAACGRKIPNFVGWSKKIVKIFVEIHKHVGIYR